MSRERQPNLDDSDDLPSDADGSGQKSPRGHEREDRSMAKPAPGKLAYMIHHSSFFPLCAKDALKNVHGIHFLNSMRQLRT